MTDILDQRYLALVLLEALKGASVSLTLGSSTSAVDADAFRKNLVRMAYPEHEICDCGEHKGPDVEICQSCLRYLGARDIEVPQKYPKAYALYRSGSARL
jgi:hypothetical protein